MNSVLARTGGVLVAAHATTRFNLNDFMAVLQGVVGFVGSQVGNRDPMAFIASGIGIAQDLVGKVCLGPLEEYLGSLQKWLTFGVNYSPLTDSSDLNFDLIDVESVPEVMKVSVPILP